MYSKSSNKKYQCIITDEFSESLINMLNKDGCLWIIIDEPFKNDCRIPLSFHISEKVKKKGLLVRNMIIWFTKIKTSINFLNRYYIILFCSNNINYKFNLDAIREPHIWKDYEWGGGRRSRYNPKGKNPSNVWVKIISEKGKILEYIPLTIDEVIQRCILASSDKEDEVLVNVNKQNFQ